MVPRVPKSFSQLKQGLTEAPIFCLSISLSQFFVLETDANIQRLGAILSQYQSYIDSYTRQELNTIAYVIMLANLCQRLSVTIVLQI